MSEYSVEEVRAVVVNAAVGNKVGAMLTAYADLLEQIERAREGVSDAEIMAEWFKADGSVHGPNVETVTMPQAKYLAFRRSVAHLLPSGERGGVDVDDGGEHDAAVWTLIALAEESGAIPDEGEEGRFWTLDLDAVYQLENQLRVRNINAGWPEPTHPPAQAAQVDAFRRGYDQAKLEESINADLQAALTPTAEPVAQHPDDAAVDAFAAVMKAKLAEPRAKGRGGWRDKDDCPQQRLSDMLRAHVAKGDPRDVANFCMFLHQRGESILPAPEWRGGVVASLRIFGPSGRTGVPSYALGRLPAMDRLPVGEYELHLSSDAQSRAVPETWRPMETAPQDGTRVLLWAEGKCRVGYWVYFPADAANPVAPTHWMPLPSAPSPGESQA
jgi:hypothetical protein